MKKSVWLSSLVRQEEAVKSAMAELTRYGLDVKGHFWTDDNAGLAWLAARQEMQQAQATAWLVMGDEQAIATPTVRYGLSALALSARARHAASLPVFFLSVGGGTPTADALPPLLRDAMIVPTKSAGWGAKVVARTSIVAPNNATDFFLDIIGDRQIGQWFEVGPIRGSWAGAIFAVSGAEINFHAVGKRGKLPERSVVEYGQKGITLKLGEREFAAWAVRNELASETSYLLRVEGQPEAIAFGSYPDGDDEELYVERLI